MRNLSSRPRTAFERNLQHVACRRAGRGTRTWNEAGGLQGSKPDMDRLIRAAQAMTSTDLAVIAVDMPLAPLPFET